MIIAAYEALDMRLEWQRVSHGVANYNNLKYVWIFSRNTFDGFLPGQ